MSMLSTYKTCIIAIISVAAIIWNMLRMVCLVLSLIRVGLMLRLISIWPMFEISFLRPYIVITFCMGFWHVFI